MVFLPAVFRDIYGKDAALEQALVSHSYPE